jgi:catechol 2,3-dioxygenase-like lactoylglutathione lyase family enzyme
MEQIIDNLLNDFERGKLSRRQLVQVLAAGALAGTATPALSAEPMKLKAISVNHISYGVADYARTRDFYADLLGMKVSQDTGQQCYLGFGDTLLTARKTRQPDGKPYIDHIAYTLGNWEPGNAADENAVEAELTRRGLAPKTDMGGDSKSFHIRDPDGFNLQLCAPLKKSLYGI